MTEEAVEPQEKEMDQVVSEAVENEQLQEPVDSEHYESEETIEQKMVPLHVVQKERQKRKEMELELQWIKQKMDQQSSPQPQEEDESQYESATKADLGMSQRQTLRILKEELWCEENPDKYELVNEGLPKFLKQKPHLRLAIQEAPNRYKEAFELMDRLSPSAKTPVREQKPKREAPNSPGSVPKAAALNEAIDVMKMSDSEYHKWRESKRKRR